MQRLLIGFIGLFCLLLGTSFYLAHQNSHYAAAGILVRVGCLLAAIWLAWPQFESLKSRASMLVLSAIFGMLLLVAARPRFFPFAAALLVGGLFLNGVLRRFANSNKQR
jgi:hypothetical protein